MGRLIYLLAAVNADQYFPRVPSFKRVINWIKENHGNSKHQKPNFKRFDKPFDRLTVLSKVEGQIPMTKDAGVRPAAGLKSGQSNIKRNFVLG
jgi:hypothetical protein